LIQPLDFIPLNARGLTQETCKKYGYGISKGRQIAPYYNEQGRIVAQKVRGKEKTFAWTGSPKDIGLFGQQLARNAGKMIVITEGEIDAMSVCQAMGGTWPALSVPNGAQGAANAIKAQLDFLNQYEKVVLCFDADEPGQEATEECVELFTPGKVAIANLGSYKDANEALLADPATLRQSIWEAKVYRPDGVVNMADQHDRINERLVMGQQYPWKGLNKLLFGYRPGELITWCAGTGTGKTAVVSELVYDMVMNDVPTGVIYLEEGLARAGKRIVGMYMDKPLHLTDDYTSEEFEEAWNATLGKGKLFAYDHFGSLNEELLVNRIRYMVKGMGCRVIVLDHVSMVVSGADLDSDERRMLDHIVTTLVSLAQETGATIHMVSHLRRPPGHGSHEEGRAVSLSDLRGTQAIGQLSYAVVALERDQQAPTEEERNRTTLRVLKNRYAGTTGVACQLQYDPNTGRLHEISEAVASMPEEDY
jgi:twinkle protein